MFDCCCHSVSLADTISSTESLKTYLYVDHWGFEHNADDTTHIANSRVLDRRKNACDDMIPLISESSASASVRATSANQCILCTVCTHHTVPFRPSAGESHVRSCEQLPVTPDLLCVPPRCVACTDGMFFTINVCEYSVSFDSLTTRSAPSPDPLIIHVECRVAPRRSSRRNESVNPRSIEGNIDSTLSY